MNTKTYPSQQLEDEAFPIAVLDSIEDILAVLDKNGTIITVNEAWKLFAQSNGAPEPLENGVGINYLDVCRQPSGDKSEEAQVVLEGIQSVLDHSKESFSLEYPCHSPQEKRWYLLKAAPLPCKYGGAVITHINITDRKLAEDALRESKERYRRLVSLLPEAMFTCDGEGLITYYNQRAAELWGREPKLRDPEDRYCGSFLLFRPDGTSMPHDQCPMAEAVLKGIPSRNREIMIEKPDGNYVNAEVNIDPIFDEGGRLAGAINVFRDITERKRLWEENQRYKEELEDRIAERTRELYKLNRTLLAEIEDRKRIEAELEEVRRHLMDRVEAERLSIAREIHDGPIQDLYAIIFQFAALNTNDIMNEGEVELDEFVQSIRKEIERVNQTLRSITKNLRPTTLSPFGLEKSIREHAENLKQIYPNLEIDLDLVQDGQLLSEPIRLALYRIYQVAITNVIRHSQATRVRINFDIQGKSAILEVEDNGRGFEIPRRWIEFARKGHLGLIGSMERADSIGGKLEIKSETGEGTRVRVSAPTKLASRTVGLRKTGPLVAALGEPDN